MNSMKSEVKSLVQSDGKRKYAKTTLRVYGTVGEITAAAGGQKKSDNSNKTAMGRSSA